MDRLERREVEFTRHGSIDPLSYAPVRLGRFETLE